jgi:uncharacterized protein
MKKQTLLQIQIKGLPEEGTEVRGELTAADLEIPEDDRLSCPWPMPFSLHVAAVVGGLVVTGRVEVRLRGRCDRCLGYFTVKLPPVPVEHQYLDFHADVLDLTEDVRDDILLTFPSRCLCRADCKGLCSECGQNLNVRECGCGDESPDESPWVALDRLRLTGGETPEEPEK